ncbi:vacuolar protein sorting-associated protein 45 [Trichomonascus vanleenenianus]|uniref:Vps45p n=1 Tax=Trichomonascus vanleenenianus TaxID=2268995 RepID=UPI003ECBAE36
MIAGPGGGSSSIKVLLLDAETTAIVSMATTQSLLLKHDIYLIDRIDNPTREKMRHLRCIAFVRPTPESIQALVNELRAPKYASYELFFSNIVKKSHLERLAEADSHEVVTKVQEAFGDYLVVNHDLFTFNLHNCVLGEMPDSWGAEALNRASEGLVALLLSLKMRPVVRYERNSAMAKRLANEVVFAMNQERQLFDFQKRDTPPILLLLDRKNDPVTPLLMPWTYQAMVHQLIGIANNRVDLSHVPDVSKELSEIVLSGDQDAFFAKTMFLNFGDLGASIKDYVSHYQQKTRSNADIESIADMKRFVEEYPEFRRLSGNVSKHVTLVGELSRLVTAHSLLQVSELEQSLACNDSHATDLKQLQELLVLPTVDDESKVRLVGLYALRYQRHSNNGTESLLALLSDHAESVSAGDINALKTLFTTYAGAQQRQENLFGSDSFFAKAQSGFKGLKGVENVYTQHSPLLQTILAALVKGKLKKSLYPYYDDGHLPGWTMGEDGDRPQDIVVFVIGGVTYEEARLVAEMNASLKGVRIVLGGTSIQNSASFLKDIRQASERWPLTAENSTVQERLRRR